MTALNGSYLKGPMGPPLPPVMDQQWQQQQPLCGLLLKLVMSSVVVSRLQRLQHGTQPDCFQCTSCEKIDCLSSPILANLKVPTSTAQPSLDESNQPTKICSTTAACSSLLEPLLERVAANLRASRHLHGIDGMLPTTISFLANPFCIAEQLDHCF